MLAFLSEYGKVIVVILLISVLVVVVMKLLNSGKTTMTADFGLFNATAEKSADTSSEEVSDVSSEMSGQ